MRVGIDISPLQGPHGMRGVGSVVRNFIKNIPGEESRAHTFFFFALPNTDTTELLAEIDARKLTHQVVRVQGSTVQQKPAKLFGKLLRKVSSYFNTLRGCTIIDEAKIKELRLDAYIQLDPTIALPRLQPRTKLIVMVHDLIPYILEADYLWSYKTARAKKCSRKSALSSAFSRFAYKNMLKQNTRRASVVLANSDYTKHDIIKYLRCPEDKIVTTHLGVTTAEILNTPKPTKVTRYQKTSWGYLPHSHTLPNKPFILFAGGADPRRKLKDLFAAYNNLRARGMDVALVLVGDTMNGGDKVPNDELKRYLKNNQSYQKDVYFLGFVPQNQLDWLYQNASVFVYPSVYEGFGLPILEAMNYGTPVITYDNTSIREIAGDAALYAIDYLEITALTWRLLKDTKLTAKHKELGKAQAATYQWTETSNKIMRALQHSYPA